MYVYKCGLQQTLFLSSLEINTGSPIKYKKKPINFRFCIVILKLKKQMTPIAKWKLKYYLK